MSVGMNICTTHCLRHDGGDFYNLSFISLEIFKCSHCCCFWSFVVTDEFLVFSKVDLDLRFLCLKLLGAGTVSMYHLVQLHFSCARFPVYIKQLGTISHLRALLPFLILSPTCIWIELQGLCSFIFSTAFSLCYFCFFTYSLNVLHFERHSYIQVEVSFIFNCTVIMFRFF